MGPQKKPYEISYKIKSVEELQAEQKETVEKVVGLLECDVSSKTRSVGCSWSICPISKTRLPSNPS